MNIYKITTAIRAVMKQRGITQNELKEKLGYKTQSAIAERLKGDMRTSVVVAFLDAMGYQLIIRPKSTKGQLPTGAYVIGLEDTEDKSK